MKLKTIAVTIGLISSIQMSWAIAPQVSCYNLAIKLPVQGNNPQERNEEKTLNTDRAITLCRGAKDSKPIECYREAFKLKYNYGKIRPDREDTNTTLNSDSLIELCAATSF